MIDILRYRQRREILYLSHPINEEGNTLQEALEEMADTQTPEESFIKREMLQGALYELSPLLAHYLWGYALASSISKETCQTYAQHTDIPANTAKQRISRARKICIAYKKAYESWIDDEAS
jgi:DNA-directed RNA polymerase specialized sigma24 family protein